MTIVPGSARSPIKNRILATLPKAEYRRLRPSLEEVALHQDQVLYGPSDVVSHVYFPNDAVVSLLFDVDARRTVEVAMEGNESAVGVAIYLGGVNSLNLCRVQHAGTAMRLPVSALAKYNKHRSQLEELLRRYIHAFVAQIAQLGVCNRFHNVDARLARWLLMTHDRVQPHDLSATQEAIANLLGVRRSSITHAASGLHRNNIIDYRRGCIEILDEGRLRAASCDCYATMKGQYDSFLN
jgi:CRP-like cAMP-binding protein